jgi:hypothetical protein
VKTIRPWNHEPIRLPSHRRTLSTRHANPCGGRYRLSIRPRTPFGPGGCLSRIRGGDKILSQLSSGIHIFIDTAGGEQQLTLVSSSSACQSRSGLSTSSFQYPKPSFWCLCIPIPKYSERVSSCTITLGLSIFQISQPGGRNPLLRGSIVPPTRAGRPVQLQIAL